MIRRYYIQASGTTGGGGGGYNVIQLAESNDENTICSIKATLYFIDDQYTGLSAGVIIYTNPSLTTPLTGVSYVRNNAGIIFAVDDLTGEVLGETGNVC